VKNLRAALHQIADLLADAIELDERDERTRKRKVTPRLPPRPDGDSDPAAAAEAERFLERKGFRKTA
jgi:hypothetical protein